MLVGVTFAKMLQLCKSKLTDLGLGAMANIIADSRKYPSLVNEWHHILVHLSISFPDDLIQGMDK